MVKLDIAGGHQVRPPRLVIPDPGSKDQRWMVKVYVYHRQREKVVLKRAYPFEAIRKKYNDSLALERAEHYIQELANLLSRGWIIDERPASSDLPVPDLAPDIVALHHPLSVASALRMAVTRKEVTGSGRTAETYRSYANVLQTWLEGYRPRVSQIRHLNDECAQTFSDYLLADRKVNNTTHNNYIIQLRSLWEVMAKRKHDNRYLVSVNPWKAVEILPQGESTINKAYSPEQMEELKALLSVVHPYLWTLVQIIFYTFIRPFELRQLQIGHIDFHRGIIVVPGSISKNRHTKRPELPTALLAVLERAKWHTYPKGAYLVSLEGRPGPGPVGRNTLGRWYHPYLKKVTGDPDLTLYSWKHTGNVVAFENGVNLKALQMQNGHRSMASTEVYLKSLGLLRNTGFTNKMNGFYL